MLGVPPAHPAVSRSTVSIVGPCIVHAGREPRTGRRKYFRRCWSTPTTLVDHMVAFSMGGLRSIAAGCVVRRVHDDEPTRLFTMSRCMGTEDRPSLCSAADRDADPIERKIHILREGIERLTAFVISSFSRDSSYVRPVYWHGPPVMVHILFEQAVA